MNILFTEEEVCFVTFLLDTDGGVCVFVCVRSIVWQ